MCSPNISHTRCQFVCHSCSLMHDTPHCSSVARQVLYDRKSKLLTSYCPQASVAVSHPDAVVVQVYQSSLTCMREAAEPLLSTFVNPCVTLYQSHQYPSCLDILATCVELFGQKPTATHLLTQALYMACSVSEPVFKVRDVPRPGIAT